jgi:hypothetical protein
MADTYLIELRTAQDDVHLRLGKCLVQIQAVEYILKRLLAVRSFGGAIDTLEMQLATRHEDYKTNTLGTLVKELLMVFALPRGKEPPSAKEDPNCDKIQLHFSMSMQFAEEELADISQSLGNLVALRNKVVHHLLELHPLRTIEGCQQAVRFLEDFAALTAHHRKQLEEWAEVHDKAKLAMSEFMQTPAYRDMLIDGIFPDGTVDWAGSGIVRGLREAATALSAGDWTRLEDAVGWLRVNQPGQIPSRYGCKNYRQAISRSQAFEVEKRAVADGRTAVFLKPKA